MVDQSASNSSAIIIAVYVREPWPTSGFSTSTVIRLSALIRSHALGWNSSMDAFDRRSRGVPQPGRLNPSTSVAAADTLALSASRRLTPPSPPITHAARRLAGPPDEYADTSRSGR